MSNRQTLVSNPQFPDTNLQSEIMEQPDVVARLLDGEYTNARRISTRWSRAHFDLIMLAARGSSDNAATYGKYLFASLNQVPVALATPSLYTLYQTPPRLRHMLVIAISQSGESTDILEVIAEAKRQGTPNLALTNRADSLLARMADETILLHAGEEKSIAATKTYTTSLAALALLASAWSGRTARMDELLALPEKIGQALRAQDAARELAARLVNLSECEVIGRGFNYATAFELALKLKELTYLHAEPSSSADFLHGPVALVDERFRAIVFAPSGMAYENVVEFTQRINRDGARVIGISDRAEYLAQCDAGLRLPPDIPEWLSPLVSIVPGQLFALALAQIKGYDVDHPRRLTKVTRTV